jgi:plastocyanin
MSKTTKKFRFFIFVLAGAFVWVPVSGDASPSGGTLEGTLTVTAPSRQQAPASETGGAQPFYDGGESESTVVRRSPPEEVVVYLEDVPGSYPPPKEHVRLDQKFLQFTHRVLPVLRGTVVDFTNHDPVYHNVFSNSQVNKFDLGRKGRGEKSSVRMLHPEVPVKVYCEIHADMKSNILVLNNPFFTSVKPGEKFKIEGIPPGTYNLVAWHDYWEPVEEKVTIEEGGTTRADVTLSQVQK